MFKFKKDKKCLDPKILFLFGLACGVIIFSIIFSLALLIAKNASNTKRNSIAENKKIKVELFDDFECPYCLRHSETIAQMRKEYGGKINLVFKNFPLAFHSNAQKAAEAYECAKEQNKGWEMYDKIFEANKNKNMSVDAWKSAAQQLEINTSQFNSCLDSGKYTDEIKQEQAEGTQKGVRGVPATFINGEMIPGAVPYSAIKDAIEKNLK
ncbi:MAG: thioredoxin domain-containing protein [bacterium]